MYHSQKLATSLRISIDAHAMAREDRVRSKRPATDTVVMCLRSGGQAMPQSPLTSSHGHLALDRQNNSSRMPAHAPPRKISSQAKHPFLKIGGI